MKWDDRYRRLDAGEIIEEGDEVLTDSHLGWQPAAPHTVGTPAPDPSYTAHRVYRRLRGVVARSPRGQWLSQGFISVGVTEAYISGTGTTMADAIVDMAYDADRVRRSRWPGDMRFRVGRVLNMIDDALEYRERVGGRA